MTTKIGNMKFEAMEPMVPNKDGTPINPFNQDFMLMGSRICKNVTIMGSNLFDSEEVKWFVIINTVTGERVKVSLEEHERQNIYEPIIK